MKKYEKFYQELRKTMTDEEIVEVALIPQDLTKEETKAANEEMRKIRLEMIANMTDEEKLIGEVMRLRFQIANYVKKGDFNPEQTFGKYLGEYIRLLDRNRRTISDELAVHYTKLSRLINDKEEPNIELAYRLEAHSGEMIPAILWWKLVIKKQEHLITKDTKKRKAEAKKVKNSLRA